MTAQPADRSRLPFYRRPATLFAAFAIVWACVAYTTFLNLPFPPTPGLDRSWQFYLSYATVHHLQFGRDIEFTLGPLGHVIGGAYLPGLYVLILYALLFPAVVIGLVLWYAYQSPSIAERIVFMVLVGLAATNGPIDVGILVLAWAALRGRVYHPGIAFGMGALAGLTALMKIDIAVDCATLYIVTAALSSRDAGVLVRTAFLYLLAFAIVFVAFFDVTPASSALKVLGTAAAGALAAVAYARIERFELLRSPARAVYPACAGILIAALTLVAAEPEYRRYLAYAFELLRGYSSAMSVPGDPVRVVIALVFAATIAGLLARLGGDRRGFAIGLGVVLFLAFKHGFVRQDTHVLGYFQVLAVVAAVVFVMLRGRTAKLVAVGLVVAALAVKTNVELTAFGFSFIQREYDATRVVRVVTETPGAIAQLLALTDSAARAGLASEVLPPALTAQLSPGTVAALPWEINVLYANALPIAQPPVPQLYSVYTTALDEADRTWVESPRAAANVLYQFIAIDGRYPMADAPATAMALWCRYRFVAAGTAGTNSYALLRRTAGACTRPAFIERRSVGWDEPFTIPPVAQGQAIAVHLRIRRNVLGALAELLYRLDPLIMRVTTAGGPAENRILAGNADDGIILQPFLAGQGEFDEFFSGRLAAGAEAVRVRTSQPWLYASQFVVELDIVRRVP